MPKKTKKIGYCALTADILHYGHIIFLTKCREYCNYLIVGVMTDECVKKYKGELPTLPLFHRLILVRSLKMVDLVIHQTEFEFNLKLLKSIGVNVIFDSEEHKRKGADYYFPYTTNISSSQIKCQIISEK